MTLMQQVTNWLAAGAPHDEDHNLAGFDYLNWIEETKCGTIACIAGAAVQFNDPLYYLRYLYEDSIGKKAQELLGLTEEQATLLFYPFDKYDDLEFTQHLPPQKIAKVLQHFIDTNEIDWEMVK